MNLLKSAQQFGQLWSSWLGSGGKPVPKDQSQSRANVCLKCPMNVRKPIYESLAGPVAKLVRSQIELKNRMKLRVDGEKSLGVCNGCSCILILKVHAPLEFILSTTDTKNLDPNCFILDEAKGP